MYPPPRSSKSGHEANKWGTIPFTYWPLFMNASLKLFLYLSKTLKEHSASLGGDSVYVQHLLGLLYKHSPKLLDPVDYSSHYMVLVGSFSQALDLSQTHNRIVKEDLIHTLQWLLNNDISSKALMEALPQEIENLEWTWDVLKASTETNSIKGVERSSSTLSIQIKDDAPQLSQILSESPSSNSVPLKEPASTSETLSQTTSVSEQVNQDEPVSSEHPQGNESWTVA